MWVPIRQILADKADTAGLGSPRGGQGSTRLRRTAAAAEPQAWPRGVTWQSQHQTMPSVRSACQGLA